MKPSRHRDAHISEPTLRAHLCRQVAGDQSGARDSARQALLPCQCTLTVQVRIGRTRAVQLPAQSGDGSEIRGQTLRSLS
jgi:hypothetical protein